MSNTRYVFDILMAGIQTAEITPCYCPHLLPFRKGKFVAVWALVGSYSNCQTRHGQTPQQTSEVNAFELTRLVLPPNLFETALWNLTTALNSVPGCWRWPCPGCSSRRRTWRRRRSGWSSPCRCRPASSSRCARWSWMKNPRLRNRPNMNLDGIFLVSRALRFAHFIQQIVPMSYQHDINECIALNYFFWCDLSHPGKVIFFPLESSNRLC